MFRVLGVLWVLGPGFDFMQPRKRFVFGDMRLGSFRLASEKDRTCNDTSSVTGWALFFPPPPQTEAWA